MEKENIRRDLLKKLSSLSNDEIQNLSLSLTNQIIKFLKSFPHLIGQTGAGYLPLEAEIAPVYQELLKEVPVNLAYPILKGSEMSMAVPQGIPKGYIWLDRPYIEIEPKWVLVPGVGFDLSGARLGRGRGFYDRYLEKRDVIKIGLAWSEQIKERIPVEAHDSHMDFIITENFCWDVNQQRKF
ncbi:MAG: 5-formyltetrahydrofolate cyclo-ligase [Bacteriovoracaceae bacterium]